MPHVSTNPLSDAVPRFCADAPEHFRLAQLDTFAALFHRRSGITHVISEPVPEILAALATNPQTLDELIANLSTAHEFEPGEDVRVVLAERLTELEAAGLVFRT